MNLKAEVLIAKWFSNLEVVLRGFIALASRADVYTTSASASNVSVYTNTICVAKCLLGTPKPLNCIQWMQTVRLHR